MPIALAVNSDLISLYCQIGRDIVGRLLKNFEQRELVSLGRERIRVLNPEGLKELAERQG